MRYEYDVPKDTRARRSFDDLPPWKKHRTLDRTNDRLSFRLFLLEHEGRETLHNSIRGDHNLPNRY